MGNKAATLAEVLIVVIIVAILAGIAFSSYQYLIEKARDKEAIAVIQSIAAAEIRYYDMFQTFYPNDAGDAARESNIISALDVKFKYAPDADWYYCVFSRSGEGSIGNIFIFAKRAASRPPGMREVWRLELEPDGAPPAMPESRQNWNDACNRASR